MSKTKVLSVCRKLEIEKIKKDMFVFQNRIE